MKIQLLSDLHLEAHPRFCPTPASDADVLVLAGDIGSYQSGSSLQDSDFGLARFSPRAGWPTPVLFVPGNHEYDNLDFDAAHARLQASCERLGIVWLERQTAHLSIPHSPTSTHRPVRFIGTTLWSDFDAFGIDGHEPHAVAATCKARDKAFRAANFYLHKTGTTRNSEPFLAPQVRSLSLQCQQWLLEQLAEPFAGPTVVITHFAPSLRSADPRYGTTPGTAGFCNRLDDLFPRVDLWLHGHLHCPSDYLVGNCRVVANPLGYSRKGEQNHFNPTLCLSV